MSDEEKQALGHLQRVCERVDRNLVCVLTRDLPEEADNAIVAQVLAELTAVMDGIRDAWGFDPARCGNCEGTEPAAEEGPLSDAALEAQLLAHKQCEQLLIVALQQIAAEDPHNPGWRRTRARDALISAKQHAVLCKRPDLAERYEV